MFPYDLLWPLFELCSDPQALRLPHNIVVQVNELVDSKVVDSYELPVDLVLSLCPTPTMDVLLLAAALGWVLILGLFVWSLGGLVGMVMGQPAQPSAQMQAQQIVEAVVQEVDELSEEFLRQV